jgi:hypothetical protein
MATLHDSGRTRSAFALTLISAVFLTANAQPARAGVNVWTTHGPYWGGSVHALAIDPQTPTTLYAGTEGGVYRSTNSGASWSAVNTGLTNLYVWALAINPTTSSTVYASTYNGGVFKTTDSGASWSAISGYGGPAGALVIDPTTPSTLYAGTDRGVFRSTDSGASWSVVWLPPYGSTQPVLAIDPHTPNTVYVGGGWGVYKSTNSGSTWNQTEFPGLPVFDSHTPSTFYAVAGGRVYQTTDSGASWSALNTPGTVQSLAIDPSTPSTLFAGTGSPGGCHSGSGCGIFKTTNGGTTWSAAITTDNSGNPLNINALAIDPQTPTTLYAGGQDTGVFRSTDSGATWTNSGWGTDVVSAVAIDPHTPTTLYARMGRGVFQSTNGGGAWNETNFPGVPTFDPHTPTTLYAGTGGGVFQSTNGGGAWNETNFPGVPIFDPQTPSTLYAVASPVYSPPLPMGDYGHCSGGGVFKSTDSGGSWSAVNTGLPSNAETFPPITSVTALAIDPQTPSTLYAGAASCGLYSCTCPGEGIFQSTNSGASWSAANTGLPADIYIKTLAIAPTTPSTVYAGTGSGLFQSTDSGAGWSAVNIGLTDHSGNPLSVAALAINPHTPSTLYAGTGSGVFQSTNSGASWSALNIGLTDNSGNPLSVAALALDPQTPSTLYAGTGAGVFDIEGIGLTCVVGTGTSDSCTEAALDACLPGGAWFNGQVTFNCGGAATITVDTYCPPTCRVAISADTTIDGGSVITISGHGGAVFSVNPGVKFTVQNLTIANGDASNGEPGGGAILNNGGTVTVSKSTLTDNSTNAFGWGANALGGGAIYNGGTLTVTASTFSDNLTRGPGGGIVVRGGAIYNAGTLTVTNSTFSGNSTAGGFSGAGGAIYNGGTLTVANSTFSGNGATGDAGVGVAIANDGSATLKNTIIANSVNALASCSGTITDGGYNIEDDTSCGFTGAGCSNTNGTSFCNTEPNLDPTGLMNNGGPTQTIALEADSPAIDAGDPEVCANPPVNGVDQRGYVRPGMGFTNCSIGAYEFDSPGPPFPGCVGDCHNDGHVTVDEILTMVNIALGNAEMWECDSGDAKDDGQITVDEILMAVNNALNGCDGG